jgi:hypothetical protein
MSAHWGRYWPQWHQRADAILELLRPAHKPSRAPWATTHLEGHVITGSATKFVASHPGDPASRQPELNELPFRGRYEKDGGGLDPGRRERPHGDGTGAQTEPPSV